MTTEPHPKLDARAGQIGLVIAVCIVLGIAIIACFAETQSRTSGSDRFLICPLCNKKTEKLTDLTYKF